MPLVKGKKATTKKGISKNKRMEHLDVKEDKKLVKKMVKKNCMK